MRAPGPLLASGRDADIFDYGPGLVLRRSRNDRSLVHEATIIEYVRGQGYPVPRIDEVSDDGRALVMERIEGPSMADFVARAPWAVRRQAKVLAALHQQLHGIAPADFLTQAPVGQGGRIVHLDLHPLNVIIGPTGPVVIDWSNAALGDPTTDIGLAWILMTVGQVTDNVVLAKIASLGQHIFANAFIAAFDRAAVTRHLRDVVEWKARDPHMSTREVQAMWRMVSRMEARS